MLSIRHDSRKSCRIVTSEVESPHRKSNRDTHCVKHEGRGKCWRFDTIRANRVESLLLKSNRHTGSRIVLRIVSSMRVVCKMLTIRHDSRESCRIVTCEVESSHRKSNRVRKDISHLEIIIPIHVRGCHIAKDNNKSVIGFGGVRHDLSGRVILKVNVFQRPAD